jgi:hypothetical protein
MRPIHFEYQSPDPAASMNFFSEALDWEFEGWHDFPYWLATTGPEEARGINGAVMPTPDGSPRTVIIMEVPNIVQALDRVAEAGGEVVLEVQDIPGVGQSAYCRDPQGLLFGLFQGLSGNTA